MRPVGPEPTETYWLRRALVVGAMLVLLIIVLIFLFNLGDSPGQAAPGPASSPTSAAAPTSASPSPTLSPTPSESSAATPSASSSVSPSTSADPSGTASPSASDSGRASDKATGKSSASGEPSGTASGKSTAKPSGSSSKKPGASSSPAPTAKPEPVACKAKELRPTLHSDKHNVAIGSKVRFDVSFINGSDDNCVIKIDPKDYELKIYSGTDRIWSSDDCARLVPEITRSTKPEAAVEWTMTWNGKRSAEGKTCKSRPEIPAAGYYYATSQLKGAKPVQFLLVLK